MYYSYQKKLYTKEQLAGQTFDETDKPEPLLTAGEAYCAFLHGATTYDMNAESKLPEFKRFLKEELNITI